MLIEAPGPETCLRLIEEHRLTSFFAPPTVWISLLRSPDFARRDLSSLARVYYGASIMPVPVLEELRTPLPGARPYNCYGQSEIAPLATVLRPEEHDDRPASCGRPVFNVETRVVDDAMQDVAPASAARSSIARPADGRLLEQAGGDGGGLSRGLVPLGRCRDHGRGRLHHGGRPGEGRDQDRRHHRGEPRGREVLFTHPSVSEVAVIALPHPRWIEAVTAIVVLRPGTSAEPEDLIAHCRTGLAPFKSRSGSCSRRICPATPPASCSSASCGCSTRPSPGRATRCRAPERGRSSGRHRRAKRRVGRPVAARPDQREQQRPAQSGILAVRDRRSVIAWTCATRGRRSRS